MRLTQACPVCGKILELKEEFNLGTEILQVYRCGHSFAKGQLEKITLDKFDFTSVDGSKHARQYQMEGIKFIIDSGFACMNGDQMRLGKTPQALLALKNGALDTSITPSTEWPSNPRLPALVLVRAANLYQWFREIKTWFSNLPNSCWIIQGTKNWIAPGFQTYLMSMDTFGRRGTCKSCKHQYHDEECKKCEKEGKTCRTCMPAGDAMSDILLEFGFRVVIVDEAHSFKNTDSNRSRALTCFLKEIEQSKTIQEITFHCMMCKEEWNETIEIVLDAPPDRLGTRPTTKWTEWKADAEALFDATDVNSLEETKRVSKTSHCPKCFSVQQQSAAAHLKVTRQCGVVMLTGTAIKNRADEFFVPLNLIAPEKFPSLINMRRKWLIQDAKGAWSRVNPHSYNRFKEEIAPFFLRREKEDVYKELPKLNRLFTMIDVTDERIKKAYNQVLDELEIQMVSHGGLDFFSSIGQLQKLRQICGMAKVPFISDYAETFVCDSEKAKLAIGCHHHLVRDTLAANLSPFGTLKLSGEDSPQQKDRIMTGFETSAEQILIINMLAGGVGMDFHYCDNVLIAERQWNSADEEQFEFRFYNPDPTIKTRPTNVEYIIIKGGIEQFFYEMVEDKRVILGETIGTNWSLQDDPMSFRQLMEQTMGARM